MFSDEQFNATHREIAQMTLDEHIEYPTAAVRLLLEAREKFDTLTAQLAKALQEREAMLGDVHIAIAERDRALKRLTLYRQMAPQAIINQVEPEHARQLPETKPNMKVTGYAERIIALEAENAQLSKALTELERLRGSPAFYVPKKDE